MSSATDIPPPIGHPLEFYVGGEWVAPSTGDRIDVIAPATEQLYLTVAEAQEADIDRAVAAARAAFDTGPWPRLSHAERAGFLRALAGELEKRGADIAVTWPNEMGVLHSFAQRAAFGVAYTCRSFADLADSFAFEERHPTISGARYGLLVHEPVGVVGAIIPWNAPMGLLGFKLVPALLAGCTVVVKSSPEAPSSGLIMAEAAAAIGLPPGVLNVVTADRVASEALVRHPGVDKITFTGSSVAGRRIASLCGGRMARFTMELGGKSAAIVLDDYDVELAATTIGGAATNMTGQTCASLTRIIVPRASHDRLVEALGAVFASVRVGDPFDPASQMGPLASARQRDRVEGHIAGAKADGFLLATGGGRPRGLDRGFFVEPTVFGNVDNRSTIAREEIFGPVLSVIPVRDEDEAVAVANDSPYGLGGAVFTNDPERAYRVARAVRTGTMGHNSIRSDFTIGFGGFKQSGVGREGGVEGLRAFLETKTILLDELPAHLRDA